jgi:hypothetical protein
MQVDNKPEADDEDLELLEAIRMSQQLSVFQI